MAMKFSWGQILKLSILVFIVSLYAFPASAAEKQCSSFNANYEPPRQFPSLDNLKYTLEIEPIKNYKAGEDQVIFAIYARDIAGKALSKLNMKFSCGGGSVAACSVSYKDGKNKKNEDFYRSFKVIPLAKDFKGVNPVTVDIISSMAAPDALILPDITSAIYYTQWDKMGDQIIYYSDQKVHPINLPEIWVLKDCN